MSIERSFEELRNFALELTRTQGRRVTEQELRSRVGDYAGLDEDVDRLVRQGLVARTRIARDHHRQDRDERRRERRSEHVEEQFERFARKAEKWIRNISGGNGRELTESEEIDGHIQKVSDRAEHEISGLRGHTVSFLGVNAGLFTIWALTTAPGFPWFLIPFAGWGIGYVTHRVEVRARRREADQVQKMKRPSLRHLQLHHKLWKKRRGFLGHFSSSAMVAVLLGTINVITGTAFPWALIPAAALAVGVFSHLGGFKVEERKLLRELDETALEAGPLPSLEPAADGTLPPAQIAEELRERITMQLESLPVESPLFDQSFHDNINAYVQQVQRLAVTGAELKTAIDSIPIDNLDTDRARLISRRDAAPSERMRTEYEKSIEQIDRQKQSYSELKSEQEMIDLRIGNAINALRQLHLDVTRMKSMTPSEGEAALDSLRRRSEELGRYLSDLREGYDELG